MSIRFKKIITVFVITMFFVPTGVSEESDNTNSAAWSDHKFGLLKLVRKSRETIVGNGCPKGRFRYYGRCKSFKELRTSDYDDIIDVQNETRTLTPTATVREYKVETIDSDINLSIIPLPRPEMITEPTSIINALEIVEKSKLLVTESNLTVTIRTPKETALKSDVSDSSHAMTGPSQSEPTEPITPMPESESAKAQFTHTVEIESQSVMTNDEPILQDTFNRSSTKQISTPEFVNTFAVTDLSPIVMETTTATEGILTRVDSTFAVLETTPVGKSKRVMTDIETILKDTSKGGSAVTAYSTSMTMWTEIFSNSESGPASSLTNTGTTESNYATTGVSCKDVPGIIVQNDQMSNISFKLKLFLFILMLVVFCFAISNWIFEPLYVILCSRRAAEENPGQYVSKEEESLV